MWIVTRGENDYSQYGDYFVACFEKKPTYEEFEKIYLQSECLSEDSLEESKYLKERIKHYYDNKGRTDKYENTWYFLSEIKEGELYKPQYSRY